MSNYYGLVNGLLCDTRGVLQAYTLQMNTLLGSGFQCRGGLSLSWRMDAMASTFRTIELNLRVAASAASKMDMDSYSPAAMKWKISQRVKSSATIRMDYSAIDGVVTALRKISRNLNAQVAACGSIINTFNASSCQIDHRMLMDPLKADGERLKEEIFRSARNAAVDALSSAEKVMVQAGKDWDGHIAEIEKVKSSFAAADKKVKAKLTECSASQAIAESKAYTKVSSSKERTAVKNQVTKLEAIQAEYKASHGNKESADLKKEITRLNELLTIRLTTMSELREAFGKKQKAGDGDWLNQKSSHYGPGRCMAVAYAVGYYITTKKVTDPESYVQDKSSGWSVCTKNIEGTEKSSEKEDAKVICENLEKGLPSLIHSYSDASPAGHWVTVVGVRGGADKNNLKLSDFIVFNPAGATYGYFSKGSGFKYDGYRKFTK